MQNELEKQLSKLPFQIRRIYAHLAPDARAEFETSFRRHQVACDKCGCGVDPMWVGEALRDARAGAVNIG